MATATLDPVLIQVTPVDPSGELFSRPVSPVYTNDDMWGGVFVARPDPDLSDDRTLITSFGFTILSERQEAGETHIYAWGITAQVSNWTGTMVMLQTQLPYFFWKLEKDKILDLALITRGPAHPGDVIKF